MTSLTRPDDTIRMQSRSDLARQPDRSEQSIDGFVVDLQGHPADHLETLPYDDAYMVEDGGRAGSQSAMAPSIRLDVLLATQPIDVDELRRADHAVIGSVKPRTAAQEFGFRSLDVLVSLIVLVLVAPIMVLVAVAVRLDSQGPIFYGSERLGQRDTRFKAWKFRSMRPDADEVLAEVLDGDPDLFGEYVAFNKLRNDPRSTRVGSFIRRTSLDEVPQFLNVLKGDMSLVGPRPKLPTEVEAYGPALSTVLEVRPGLTGLWQVSGRNDLSMNERVRLDLDYVHNRSFVGDLWICVRTAVQLCNPRNNGAY